MTPKHRIALVALDEQLMGLLALRLESKGYQAVILSDPSSVLGFIYSDPPDMVIIDLSTLESEIHMVIQGLREDSYFSTLPVIGLLMESKVESFEWKDYPLDDFVTFPIQYPELFSRIVLSMQRNQRVFDNNPLTKLPGNTSIQKAIDKALGLPLAVCYLDINKFKPYNDTYGFARGDEVIRMVARIISNTVQASKEKGFSGHIGGDDFVFILPFAHAEIACKKIISDFNLIVSDLFCEEDREKGFYIAKDRGGKKQQYPLLGIAIAVIPTATQKIMHYGKVAEIAAELKSYAKNSTESRYVIDRRHQKSSPSSIGRRKELLSPGSDKNGGASNEKFRK